MKEYFKEMKRMKVSEHKPKIIFIPGKLNVLYGVISKDWDEQLSKLVKNSI